MPLIRIDVPEGTAREKKEIIHKRVREVVLKTLAPKQVKYDYVSIREAFGIIGDFPLFLINSLTVSGFTIDA